MGKSRFVLPMEGRPVVLVVKTLLVTTAARSPVFASGHSLYMTPFCGAGLLAGVFSSFFPLPFPS